MGYYLDLIRQWKASRDSWDGVRTTVQAALVPAYEVRPPCSCERGIPLVGGRIVVGQQGVGLRRVAVPLPEGSVIEDGKVVAVPITVESGVAVVVIRDFSGYFGTWYLTEPLPDHVLLEYDIDGGAHERYEVMLATCPRHLVAFGRRGQGASGAMGGLEHLFIGFPGETFDIVRCGSLFGEPAIVRLAIHADGTVTLTDILAEMRERDAFARW